MFKTGGGDDKRKNFSIDALLSLASNKEDQNPDHDHRSISVCPSSNIFSTFHSNHTNSINRSYPANKYLRTSNSPDQSKDFGGIREDGAVSFCSGLGTKQDLLDNYVKKERDDEDDDDEGRGELASNDESSLSENENHDRDFSRHRESRSSSSSSSFHGDKSEGHLGSNEVKEDGSVHGSLFTSSTVDLFRRFNTSRVMGE